MKNYQSQLIKAQNYEKKQLTEKFELAQQIGTAIGFFQYYFDTLSQSDWTSTECFHNVNDLHLSVFGKEKYSSMDSFRKSLKHFIKSPKK
tara:strand:- start:2866 stop:3135 length:270 start_codon:yes stop_codon:yes gene_type:complete